MSKFVELDEIIYKNNYKCRSRKVVVNIDEIARVSEMFFPHEVMVEIMMSDSRVIYVSDSYAEVKEKVMG